MLGSLLGRLALGAGRTVAAAAVNAVANELRKPETQQKIAASAARIVHTVRDTQAVAALRDSGARALGRALGGLRSKPPE